MNLEQALTKVKALECKILEAAKQQKVDALAITDALNHLKTARQRYIEAESKLEAIHKLTRSQGHKVTR